MTNTDHLAEMHYAKYDPAYETEEDLMEEKELFEQKTINYIEAQINIMLDYLSNDEMDVIKKNADYLADYLYSVIDKW